MNVLYLVAELKGRIVRYLNALTTHNRVSVILYTYPEMGDAPFGLEHDHRSVYVSSLGFTKKLWSSHDAMQLEEAKAWTKQLVGDAIHRFDIDIVHSLPYMENDFLTLWSRDVLDGLGRRVSLIHEVRDCIGQLAGTEDLYPGKKALEVYRLRMEAERMAAQVSDAQIFPSQWTRDYYFHRYGLDLENTLLIPHGDSQALSLEKPLRKLSRKDGRIHVVLSGTASGDPESGRYMGRIITRFVENNPQCVLHSHFLFIDGTSPDVYRSLEKTLAKQFPKKRYFNHPPVDHGPAWVKELGQYDFCLVLYELWGSGHARERNECHTPVRAATALALCGIPFLATPHSQGLAAWACQDGVGIIFEDWSDLRTQLADRALVRSVVKRAWQSRFRYYQETLAEKVQKFYRKVR